MDLFNLFGFGALFSVLLLLLFYFIIFIVPCLIIAASIKKIGKPLRLRVIKEYEDSFQLENDIFVYKNWYVEKYDLYDCLYGFYIPIHNGNNDVVAFLYERKRQ